MLGAAEYRRQQRRWLIGRRIELLDDAARLCQYALLNSHYEVLLTLFLSEIKVAHNRGEFGGSLVYEVAEALTFGGHRADRCPVLLPGQTIKIARSLGSNWILYAHNHPGRPDSFGPSLPSHADLSCDNTALAAYYNTYQSQKRQLWLLDSIIVGQSEPGIVWSRYLATQKVGPQVVVSAGYSLPARDNAAAWGVWKTVATSGRYHVDPGYRRHANEPTVSYIPGKESR